MNNNLFYYATSELSQDAFICWLSSFAFESYADNVLHKCAKEMLVLFVPELKNEKFSLCNIERQVKHIDVLITVSANGKCYKIVVEDKTFTKEHSNQLANYREQTGRAYPGCIVKGVYYKTGFQSDLSTVEEAKYNVVSREQIIALMASYASQTTNQIFLDYYEYWNAFQQDADSFRSLPVSEWGGKQANGFYQFLRDSKFFQKRNQWMGYDYVPNKNKGFYGLWFGAYDCTVDIEGHSFEIYPQLEIATAEPKSARLCLKIASKNNNVDKSTLIKCRDKAIYDEQGQYAFTKFNFRRPKYLRIGKHTTVGVYDCSIEDWNSLVEIFEAAIRDYTGLLATLK